MYSREMQTGSTGVLVDNGQILEIFVQGKVRFKKLFVELSETARTMLACPLGRSQRHAGIGKALWPVQLQSGFFRFALKHRVHLPAALTTRRDSPERDVGNELEMATRRLSGHCP